MLKLITVPSGTRNLKVEETFPASSNIIIQDKESKEYYLKS